ncbi:MAG: hypothetical protein ABI680_02000 [Chthoniobacteraceae bacterium]
MISLPRNLSIAAAFAAAFSTLTLVQGAPVPANGPADPIPPKPLKKGDPERGRDVFRFETFGTEAFWTDIVRLPQGRLEKKVTILSSLRNGLHFDAEALPPRIRKDIEREVKTDLSPEKAPTLNNPALMPELVRANAVIGMVERNGKTGITCCLCHTITDHSVFALGDRGSIGRRIDGPTPYSLEVGHLLAEAQNSRALYALLQLDLGGASIGRVPKYRLTKDSTEEEVDGYLNDPKAWPAGTFDETPDGVGNPVVISPLFRQDLSAPYGSSGQNDVLDDFANTIYTVLFDQSNLLTSGGSTLLHVLGAAAGDKIVADYAHLIEGLNVHGHPYVVARDGLPVGAPPSPTGKRVDEQKLLDFNAYMAAMRAPEGHRENKDAVARGREAFRSNCTSCHNVDPLQPVDTHLVPMETIWPGYKPTVISTRMAPLTPIQDSPGTFDDKMIVIDASPVGGPRGNALPLLLDLARRPFFLHDASVPSLDALLDPERGTMAPHPFFVTSPALRSDVAAFLRSLGQPSSGSKSPHLPQGSK